MWAVFFPSMTQCGGDDTGVFWHQIPPTVTRTHIVRKGKLAGRTWLPPTGCPLGNN